MFKFCLKPTVLAATLLFSSLAVQALPQTPLVCPANSAQVGNKCVCNSGYYNGGNYANGSLRRCYKVCQANFYPRVNNVGDPLGDCVACPDYSTSTGSQSMCTCDTVISGRQSTNAAGQTAVCKCPANSAIGSNGKCQCKTGWRSGGTTANNLLKFCVPICQQNFYPDILSQYPYNIPGSCTRCPTYATSTGSQTSCTCQDGLARLATTAAGQTSLCACPANAVRATSSSACACKAGFYRQTTYADGSLRTCLPECSANSYPVLSGDGKPTGECTTCPARSSSNGKAFQCTCDPATTRLETTPAGQTRKCSACPSGTAETSDGRGCETVAPTTIEEPEPTTVEESEPTTITIEDSEPTAKL